MRDDHSTEFRVGYILKQYPRLSETFVLNEIIGLEDRGVDVSIFSLRHATEGRFHPAIATVRAGVNYPNTSDRSTFVDALRALPNLRTERLGDVFEFVDLLPTEKRARLLLDAIDVAHQASDTRVDHLHAHFLTIAAHTAHIVHLLTGIPYSITAHAKDVYRHSIDWVVARRVAGHAAAVVTVCDANRDHLTRQLAPQATNLVRVYNGLGPQDPPTPQLARTAGLVLGVGRLVEKKGFDLLVDAIAKLAPRHPDIHCVIVGDGADRITLERQVCHHGLEDLVTFAGALGQHEVSAWMRRAEVLAAPCRVGSDGNQDALPTVLIEALGAGLPAVTTPVAGIPEIITHDVEGLIVAPEDPGALAAGIEILHTDPGTRARMAAAGPDKLRRRFDRRATIGELVDVMRPGAVLACR